VARYESVLHRVAMLPRTEEDFDAALDEFDRVFRRIPPRSCRPWNDDVPVILRAENHDPVPVAFDCPIVGRPPEIERSASRRRGALAAGRPQLDLRVAIRKHLLRPRDQNADA
jgi:hypothetical protein